MRLFLVVIQLMKWCIACLSLLVSVLSYWCCGITKYQRGFTGKLCQPASQCVGLYSCKNNGSALRSQQLIAFVEILTC